MASTKCIFCHSLVMPHFAVDGERVFPVPGLADLDVVVAKPLCWPCCWPGDGGRGGEDD